MFRITCLSDSIILTAFAEGKAVAYLFARAMSEAHPSTEVTVWDYNNVLIYTFKAH